MNNDILSWLQTNWYWIVIGIAGIILILLCVPSWAWLSLLGAAMILAGLLLIRKREG